MTTDPAPKLAAHTDENLDSSSVSWRLLRGAFGGACLAGFAIAAKLGRWGSLGFFVAVELILMLWIRDGLLLNILMLIYPLDGVKQWQMAI